MIMNTKLSFIALALLSFAISIKAGDKLNLRDITRGEFRAESMTEVCPLADGETYAQISDDRNVSLLIPLRQANRLACFSMLLQLVGLRLIMCRDISSVPTAEDC